MATELATLRRLTAAELARAAHLLAHARRTRLTGSEPAGLCIATRAGVWVEAGWSGLIMTLCRCAGGTLSKSAIQGGMAKPIQGAEIGGGGTVAVI